VENTYQFEYIQYFEVEADTLDEAEDKVKNDLSDPVETELNFILAMDETGEIITNEV
jgi:hypothetical protein